MEYGLEFTAEQVAQQVKNLRELYEQVATSDLIPYEYFQKETCRYCAVGLAMKVAGVNVAEIAEQVIKGRDTVRQVKVNGMDWDLVHSRLPELDKTLFDTFGLEAKDWERIQSRNDCGDKKAILDYLHQKIAQLEGGNQ